MYKSTSLPRFKIICTYKGGHACDTCSAGVSAGRQAGRVIVICMHTHMFAGAHACSGLYVDLDAIVECIRAHVHTGRHARSNLDVDLDVKAAVGAVACPSVIARGWVVHAQYAVCPQDARERAPLPLAHTSHVHFPPTGAPGSSTTPIHVALRCLSSACMRTQ